MTRQTPPRVGLTAVTIAVMTAVAIAVSPLQAQVSLSGRELKAPVIRIVDGVDLIPLSIELTPDNHVTYTMMNAGRAPVPHPFVADIYVGGVRKDTYKHAVQAPQSQVTAMSTLARVDSCTAVTIMVEADAQQVVAEANESNNERAVTLTPKCPDLAVVEMKQDWQDYNTRYRVQIKVQNVGNLKMSRSVIARAWGGPTGVVAGLDLGAWPIRQDDEIKPLGPGESMTYRLNGAFLGTDAVMVKVYLDFDHQIIEKRVDNNLGTKQFGPH